jgi:hypothetical protein
MVKADDAPKISRLVERFQFATVDRAKIENEIVAERAARAADEEFVLDAEVTPEPDMEPEAPDINNTDKLLDDLLGSDEEKAKPGMPEPEKSDAPGRAQPESPLSGDGRTPSDRPSEPISDSRKTREKPTLTKPSVRQKLREITAAKKAQETETPRCEESPVADKAKNVPAVTTHRQPKRGKTKNKKSKGQR